MTDSEIQMLLTGVALGAQGMSVLHAYWASKDARRSAARAQAAVKRSAGDRYLSSLRLYQLQHRSRA
ncbi:hypothetical protein QBA35_19110 [Streptomyces bottropensis]|uniref:Uncharacterized protein n=1 Tax=Streptomyces bottropensis TaxID=42235 RepID=A0ABU8AP04_9ACTN|nr:hypothetical protein [Streptomyces stelliscabiei]MDX2552776.1 hypothetical protein [Streptomyces stelliscabiei]